MADAVKDVTDVKEMSSAPGPKDSPIHTKDAPVWLDSFLKGELGSEERPKSDASTAKAAPEPAVKETPTPTEPKAESKPTEPKHTEPKAETKPTEKGEDKTEKRLKDTQKWANDLNQRNLTLQAQLADVNSKLEVLSKKLDGTYEEPAAPDPKVIERKAVENTRLVASHWAAVEVLNASGADGEAEIQKLVWAEDAPFQQLQKDPAVYARVMNAKLPVLEAVKVVREHEAKQRYGDSPDAMKDALRKELEQEFQQKLETTIKQTRHAVLEELKGNGGRIKESVAGLSGVRGASKDESRASEDTLNLDSLFPNFAKSAGS